ncbi:Synembryn-A [Dissostichus eleginoides]|uniref:Synembryn n=1 Tax=Dissostichus eleginoides TaxID=100907 RepID=A0AAD9EYA0_DISEL|nr:Synembryn-A [Dissostichus eleginoides]
MDVDLEGIIQCIKQGDESGVQTQLEEFNKEYAQCFFFDSEERDKRKQKKLEEFRKNKVRDYADSDSEEYDQDDPGLILRQNLALVLVRYIRAEVKCPLLRVSLRTLRILSRDKKVLGPLVTDSALLALAKLAGLTQSDASDDTSDSDFYDNILASLAEAKVLPCGTEEDEGDIEANDQEEDFFEEDTISTTEGIHPNVLERGKKDRRRKEAMKVLCNVVYNSSWAQERFSALRLICGLTARLSSAVSFSSPSSVHFYELRLMFLMTALRRELSTQLQKEGGVSIFTAALESCLQVQWKEQYECVLDPAAPPISLEASQRIIEILKILFNITHSVHRQEPSEDDAALYRHLVAILRLCLMKQCLLSDDTDELQGHTVNLLSALPLQCLDVMLTVPLEPDSMQCQGVNMDCVQTLLMFMEKRLELGNKLKEKVTPVLNLLTECCRAHRETRHYIRKHILPPLRDASHRPEEGSTVKSRLIRLMTNLDTDLKHCAADLIFVLCKENVGRFVKYTGYGNAAGLLATRGLLGGQSSRTLSSYAQYSSDSDSDTEEYRQVKDRINPPMGVDSEGKLVPMSGMRDLSLPEERKSGSENDGEAEEGEKN